MDLEVGFIKSEETTELRQRILRPHQPRDKSVYEKDKLARAFHVGARLHGTVVGTATFHPEVDKMFKAKDPFRLRGMAVDDKHRRLGIGAKLIHFSMEHLNNIGADLVWFNAREVAFPFYEMLGFKYYSDLFEIEGIGPHKVMYADVSSWLRERRGS